MQAEEKASAGHPRFTLKLYKFTDLAAKENMLQPLLFGNKRKKFYYFKFNPMIFT